MAKQERQYLTAIAIQCGIISVIDYSGNIVYYRQRGIQRIPEEQRKLLISLGLLARDWEQYKELPSYISISYEDPTIMGRARASYPGLDKIQALLNQKTNPVKMKGTSSKTLKLERVRAQGTKTQGPRAKQSKCTKMSDNVKRNKKAVK